MYTNYRVQEYKQPAHRTRVTDKVTRRLHKQHNVLSAAGRWAAVGRQVVVGGLLLDELLARAARRAVGRLPEEGRLMRANKPVVVTASVKRGDSKGG